MANFSRFLSLISGADRTVDLSLSGNALGISNLQLLGSASGNLNQSAAATTASYSLIWPSAQGASNTYLKNDGAGNLSWVTVAAGGVTSVALADGSSSPIYTISGSPVTSTGTLTFSLNTQSANVVFAGPTSGGAAQPGFRSLVSADIPSLSALYLALSGGTMSGNINMGTHNISNAGTISATQFNVGTDLLPISEGSVSGGNDSFTSLLLHFDNTLTDSSSNNFTMNSNLTPTYTSGIFGQAAIFGSTQEIFTPNVTSSGPLDISSGDYTIDFWIKPTSAGQDQFLMCNFDTGTNIGWVLTWNSSSSPVNSFDVNWAQSTGPYNTGTGTISNAHDGNYHHLAFVHNGGNYLWFADGILLNTVTSAVATEAGIGFPLAIGLDPAGSVNPFIGNIDEVRVSKGIARWTSNFTPPAVPYSATSPAITFGTNQVLSSAVPIDNTSFTNKLYVDTATATVNAINQLTGDITAGPAMGSQSKVASLVATSNATLATLSALTSASALASIGTITSGTWNGTTVDLGHGGTGQTSAPAAFAALSPMTTAGDTIYEAAGPTPARLPIGSAGQVLTVSGGLPAWVTPATSGTVTSVAFSDASTTPIYTISGSPVTSSGTLTQTLTTQSANTVFAGPTTGSAAQPSFRALVSADIPSLSATYVAIATGNAAGGYPVLDGAGKVAYAQLPSALMTFKGAWNASTNTPTLADGTGTNGDVYRASVAGTQNLGSGSQTWAIGDFAIYNGTIWQHSPAADGVSSVNGSTGAVTVNAINQLTGDVTATAASQSQSKATTVAAIQGTTVSGTTGTGNVVFSAAPTLTGLLSGGSASFSSTIAASNLSGTNTGDQTITLTGDVTGSGTGSFAATISAGSVTAAKLATVTDGITTDQNGSGSTIEVLNAPAIKKIYVAGQSFTANTSYAVRWGLTAQGETAARIYAADITTSTADFFYVIGMASSGTSVTAGQNITVTKLGEFALSSADTAFASGTDGVPVFLTASGTFSVTAPSATGSAVTRIGMIKARSATVTSNIIDVSPQTISIN